MSITVASAGRLRLCKSVTREKRAVLGYGSERDVRAGFGNCSERDIWAGLGFCSERDIWAGLGYCSKCGPASVIGSERDIRAGFQIDYGSSIYGPASVTVSSAGFRCSVTVASAT